MITELATIIYNNLMISLTGKTGNVYYKQIPEYTNLDDIQVYYDFSGTDFPESLDNNKLNMFNLIVTLLVRPENESKIYDYERLIKKRFAAITDDHLKDVHISNTGKNYNELLDVFEKKINMTLIYVN